jgi:hypothetical protein
MGHPATGKRFDVREECGRAARDNPPFAMKPQRMGHPVFSDGPPGIGTRVKAGVVERPEDYPWSSYRAYAFGEPHPIFISTGY